VSLVEENDDGGEGLRARVARASEPQGVYCADIREIGGGVIDNVALEIETTSPSDPNTLPQCQQSQIAQFGYFDGSVSTNPNNGNTFVALGTIRIETSGTISTNDSGADLRIHPINDRGGAIDLSVARSVNADTTYCVYERGGNFNSILYEPAENIYENGFVQFPSNEVRLPEAGGTFELPISIASPIELPVKIDLQVEFNSDSSSGDFTNANFLGSSSTIEIAPGQTSTSVTIPVRDDTLEESAETTLITFSDSISFSTVATVNIIIEDNDTPVVNPVNNNPAFTTSIGQLNATVDQLFSQGVSATDPDNDPLNFTLTNTPDWLTLVVANDRRSATITGTPTSAGNFNINVTVDDGRGGSANLAFSIQVQASDQSQSDNSGNNNSEEDVETRNNNSGGGGSIPPTTMILLLSGILTHWVRRKALSPQ
jgi:hypothetical protein